MKFESSAICHSANPVSLAAFFGSRRSLAAPSEFKPTLSLNRSASSTETHAEGRIFARARTLPVGTLFHKVECTIRSPQATHEFQLADKKRKPLRAAAEPAKAANSYSIDVLTRAINVLSVFGHAHPQLGLSEIVKAVRLPKTTVFRLLSSLVERDFCELEPQSGKYSLGFELVRLADIRRRQTNVHAVAIPVMRDIRNEVNETVILSVRSGDFRVHIDFVEGLHPMRRMADLGVRAPLYAGAASKVLLAGMEDEDIDAYLARTELAALQKTTITDKNVLWREIRAIRKRGYAESKGEIFPGGGALAAPLKDFSGKTIAVMDILTPEHRYTQQHRDRCIALLLDGARRGSERLGYRHEANTAPVRAKT